MSISADSFCNCDFGRVFHVSFSMNRKDSFNIKEKMIMRVLLPVYRNLLTEFSEHLFLANLDYFCKF